MCGIIGYTGTNECYPILKEGLCRLEYRGYDSSGVCFSHKDEKTEIYRQVGVGMEKMPISDKAHRSMCGMGHTRWATHGAVCVENAHPHRKGKTVIVHNGIIENYDTLKPALAEKYDFSSSTDTEVLCALIDSEYEKTGDPVQAISNAISLCRGSFALGIIFDDIQGSLFTTRRDSPLIVGKGSDGMYAASDLSALSGMIDGYFIPEKDTVCRLISNGVTVYRNCKKTDTPPLIPISNTGKTTSDKGEFEHYMLKEIYETGKAVQATAQANIKDGEPYFSCLSDEVLENLSSLSIVACGTAMHAGLCAKWLTEKLCGINVDVFIASEFRYSDRHIGRDDTVLFISQSGETADTVGAMRLAKSKGARTVCIVNTENSTLARECDGVIHTKAGAEIAVASTKAFSAQLCALWLLAFRTAYAKHLMPRGELLRLTDHTVENLKNAIGAALCKNDEVAEMAKQLCKADSVFFIGRGLDSSLCAEASLKLKEISYIHSEACPAGELKHGTISLISPKAHTVAIVTQKSMYEKMSSNIKEVMCRGGKLHLIYSADLYMSDAELDSCLIVPECEALFEPFPAAILFQLLAYHSALLLGRQVDKPRNLAKSVTVE